MNIRMKLPVLTAIVFTIVLIAAPAALAAQGFDDKEIRIAAWGPQTGPAAAWGNVARGPNVMAAIVNAEGGIHGRKLKHFVRDDQYNPAQTKAVVKELVETARHFRVCLRHLRRQRHGGEGLSERTTR